MVSKRLHLVLNAQPCSAPAGEEGEDEGPALTWYTNEEMEMYLNDKVPSKVNELSNFTREQNPTFSGDKARVILKY